ncbi:MAG: hypothetical protein JWQ29_1910 [Phenylobacterium sp.]|nr:hypothetical protein [Phenylobacterium sp.]
MQYALVFSTKEELDDAAETLAAKGLVSKADPVEAQSALAQKLEAALTSAPLNRQKETVLRTWLVAAADEWVPYSAVVAAFVRNGIGPSEEQATNRASAAIRDLSFQVSQVLSRNDLAGFDKAIEALASRSRSAGVSYRLTQAGRVAVTRFLNKASAL